MPRVATRAGVFVRGLALAGGLVMGGPDSAEARPQYFKAFADTYPELKKQVQVEKCNLCHVGKQKQNRNNYGEALGETLSKVVGVPAAKNVRATQMPQIIQAVKETESEKSAVDDKTFGDLLKEKKLPATGWDQNVAPSAADPSSDEKGFINSLLKRLEDRRRSRREPLPDPWQDPVRELSRQFIHDILVTLRKGNPKQRIAAARALRGRLHQDLWAEHIVPLALDADHLVRASIRELLWEIGPETETAAALAFAIHHRLATAHRVELIDRVMPGDAFSVHLFPALYEDTEPRIRWALLRAVNRLRLDDADTKRFLANVWYAPDPELRRAVTETLENLHMSLDARLLVEASVDQLQESPPEDRDSIEALKRLIRSDMPVLPALARTLEQTRSPAVRAAIAEAVARIGASDPDALPLLVRLLRHDPSVDVRAVAAREMSSARADRGRALRELGDALQDEDEDVRVQLQIVSSIRALSPDDADLIRSLDDLEGRLRVIATAQSLRDLIDEASAIRNEMRAHQLQALEAITVR